MPRFKIRYPYSLANTYADTVEQFCIRERNTANRHIEHPVISG